MPVTGGSNVPALNYLLSAWGMSLTDRVFEGDFPIGDHLVHYASGGSIGSFPKDGVVLRTTVNDFAEEILGGEMKPVKQTPVLGLWQSNPLEGEDLKKISRGGRVALFGDSSCLDNTHLHKDCFWLLDALLAYAVTGEVPKIIIDNSGPPLEANDFERPQKLKDSNFYKHSKVSC